MNEYLWSMEYGVWSIEYEVRNGITHKGKNVARKIKSRKEMKGEHTVTQERTFHKRVRRGM